MSVLLLIAALSPEAGPIVEAGPTGPAQLGAELLGESALPGDAVTLVVTVRHAKDQALELPEELPDGQGLSAVGPAERSMREVGDELIEEIRYPLVLLDVGEVRSPSFKIKLAGQELEVPALPYLVLDAGPSPQAPDVGFAAMTVMRPGPPPVFYWLLILVALVVLVVLLRRFLPRRPAADLVVEAPAADPFQLASEALARLRQSLADDEERRRLWFELLAILRTYLDARFGLATAESTTEEILRVTAARPMPGVPRAELADLLKAADQVRYAGQETDRAMIADLIDRVEAWIAEAEARTPISEGGPR